MWAGNVQIKAMLPRLQLLLLNWHTGRLQLDFDSLIFVFSLLLLPGPWHRHDCHWKAICCGEFGLRLTLDLSQRVSRWACHARTYKLNLDSEFCSNLNLASIALYRYKHLTASAFAHLSGNSADRHTHRHTDRQADISIVWTLFESTHTYLTTKWHQYILSRPPPMGGP